MRFFHAGIVVADIERALDDLSTALGVSWGPILGPRQIGDWTLSSAFSKEQPYLEVLQGSEGSPWYAEHGPLLHHLGFWSGDPEGEAKALSAAGFRIAFNGPEVLGLSSFYLDAPHAGVRFELLNESYREGMAAANGIDFPAA